MQDLLKQMETLQREYSSERQTLSIRLLSAIQSQEVVTDVPAALNNIPGLAGAGGSRTMMFDPLSMLLMHGQQQNLQQQQQQQMSTQHLSLNQHLMQQQQHQPVSLERLDLVIWLS